MELTSRERILRIFENREIDRPALKLWGASMDEWLLHPAYKPVWEEAVSHSDLFEVAGSPFDLFHGRDNAGQVTYEDKDTGHPDWKDRHTNFRTPKGNLHGIERISLSGEPGYTLEHLVKEPEDLLKVLSIPWEPALFNKSEYEAKAARMGDRGVVMFGLDHAAYALHRLIGSENLAFFSVDARDLLDETVRVFSQRIRSHAKAAIEAGLTCPFMWVGPELFIPPLMSPQDFEDFVHRWDKPLCDDIHNAGGHVWVHCHGKVADFVEQYIDMGVDVLNPLEPPKNGDIHLVDIITRFGNRIGWEGNIEIQDILLAESDELMVAIEACVREGRKSGRFILCPSAGYMEYPNPTEHYIANLLVYLKHGLACCRGKGTAVP